MAMLHEQMVPRSGLRVLITAGGGGIGRRIAEGFVAAGAKVHISDINAEGVASFVDGGPNCSGSVSDARSVSQMDALFDDAMRALGGVDVAVANAGIAGPTAPVDEIDQEEWDQTLDVCLRASWRLAHCAAKELRANAGLFIGLSSAAGRFGYPNRSPYASAKWGVVGLVKTLAMELGPHGARANAILPGVVAGERIKRVISARAEATGQSDTEVEAGLVARTSMRRMVSEDEIAGACLFLASPIGSAISGQAIAVDAGLEVL
ncbi:MAG: SDR family oxidoreductase [Neomegalonema sp.]|nr:SDR family oxidoreductase [Neomegalonema sp.]